MDEFDNLPIYKPNTLYDLASARVLITDHVETRVLVEDQRIGFAAVIIADFLTIALLMCSVMSMNAWPMILVIMLTTLLSRVLLNATVLYEFNPDHYALTIIEVIWRLQLF